MIVSVLLLSIHLNHLTSSSLFHCNSELVTTCNVNVMDGAVSIYGLLHCFSSCVVSLMVHIVTC